MNSHTDIPPAQWLHILEELDGIEKRESVKVLFAVESGSRAWGFPSPDSDFDVRFVYVHTKDWYLSLSPGRDVIELPLEGDDDINGWDIRKALGLALKPNPVLLEWLSSPIRYRWNDKTCDVIDKFTRQITHGSSCRHHYMRMADMQRGKGAEIKLKKYFYALRAAMALRWIETRDDLPPMNFQCLMEGVEIPADVNLEILRLLDIKRSSVELGVGNRIPILEAFLEQQIGWAKAQSDNRISPERLIENRQFGDALFRQILNDAWC